MPGLEEAPRRRPAEAPAPVAAPRAEVRVESSRWNADLPEEAPADRGGVRTESRKPRAKGGEADPEARARRLARVLVSDILCYNQEKRDRALVDGNLMTVLGDEIKKSWELYKEKIGPDLAKSTNYFKEALNEILADGQKVF
jgi:hypothetical protein